MRITVVIAALVFFNQLAAAEPDGARQFHASLRQQWGTASVDSVELSKGTVSRYRVTVKSGPQQAVRSLYVAAPEKPVVVLWLFHGYKPAGDRYQQAPELFFARWKLKELAEKYRAVIVCVDSGTSIYPFRPKRGLSEVFVLTEIFRTQIAARFPDLPVITAGVSTGVEGAVKVAPFITTIKTIIAISGTFNYDTLPEGGELSLHVAEFGEERGWNRESPEEVLMGLNDVRIVILSEQNSIYHEQARAAAGRKYPGVTVLNRLDTGVGYGHSWRFWGSAPVLDVIEKELAAAATVRK